MSDLHKKQSWDDFYTSGLLTFMNRALCLFGWILDFERNADGHIVGVCPARLTFRDSTPPVSDEAGFAILERHLGGTMAELREEMKEGKL